MAFGDESSAKVRARTRKGVVIPDGFDVTAVIGRVTFGAGNEHANEAAFRLIAQHNAPGRYSFPGEDGTIHVTVEHETPTGRFSDDAA